jgi:hypothetical protein
LCLSACYRPENQSSTQPTYPSATRREGETPTPPNELFRRTVEPATEEPPTETPTPQPTIDPERDLGAENLQKTAVVVREQGRDNTFMPEGEFTQEVFDRVRESTVYVSIPNIGSCSGWVSSVEENEASIVIARHCVSNKFNTTSEKSITDMPPSIALSKPEKDENMIFYSVKNIAYFNKDEGPDILVVRVNLQKGEIFPYKAIQYKSENEASIQQGEKACVVGYPYALNGKGKKTNLILGEVIKFDEKINTDTNPLLKWSPLQFSGEGGPGLSGALIVKVDEDNNPYVIASVSAGSFSYYNEKSNGNVAGPTKIFASYLPRELFKN